MHLQSDAVPQAVAEGVGLAGEDFAGTPVDGIGGRTRLHQGYRFELRLTDGLDDAGLLGARFAHHDRPGGVAVVSGGGRAEIHHNHVAALEHTVGSAAMGQGTAFACGNDRLEGWTVGSQLAEGLLQEKRDIPLA